MFQYLYLNQIPAYTKGRAEPAHVLHTAANGLITLYAHTHELAEYGSRLSPISAEGCQLIERKYNWFCSFNEPEEFAESAFILAGDITEEMRNGGQPFNYSLHEPRGHTMDTPRLQKSEEMEGELKSHKIITKLSGSDFVVLKDDIDTLFSPPTETGSTPLPDDFRALYGVLESGELPHLDLLITAWRMFWKGRRPNDGRDYPINSEVVEWVKSRMDNPEKGHSKAKAIASIIRPTWAPTGRQPNRNQ